MTEAKVSYDLVEKQPTPDAVLGTETAKVSRDITWANLNFNVRDKAILSQCWGQVKAKQVCAIMGPSGAGKSSLLNVLAGRSASGPGIAVEGKVTVGGMVINPVAFRKNIAYVMQDDALLATATPREALTFSATMRLPDTVSAAEIQGLVDKLLSDLGLTVCADVMIGGAMIKGISGGQRKRTSVGVELITNPALLFLDEPTSGLDSYSAYSLVKLLREVAQRDCTILCTIHQPSSQVFFLFDIVIFMKDGRIFYQGPVTSTVQHYSHYGYECPQNYNPSDFIMNLIQVTPSDVAESKGLFMSVPAELEDKKVSNRLDDVCEFHSASSFTKQLRALTYREFTNTIRDVGALIGRFGVTIFLNLLFGLIFLDVGSDDQGDDGNFSDHFGAIAMCLIAAMFGTAQPVMLAFPFERPMFLREYSTGTYGATAYFLSKALVEIPVSFLQQLVAWTMLYFMLSLQGNYILIVLAAWGLGAAAASVAVLLGCSLPDVKSVTEMSPLLFVPQMLFVGFFIRVSQIPDYLRWAQYLCSLKYAVNLVIINEFAASTDACSESDAARENCRNLLRTNDASVEDFYIYIILLFALYLGFRLAGAFILVEKARKFY